jgi:hypothetical protein
MLQIPFALPTSTKPLYSPSLSTLKIEAENHSLAEKRTSFFSVFNYHKT